MMRWVRSGLRGRGGQSGATATEYLIILVLVAVTAISVWTKYGKAIQAVLAGATTAVGVLAGTR